MQSFDTLYSQAHKQCEHLRVLFTDIDNTPAMEISNEVFNHICEHHPHLTDDEAAELSEHYTAELLDPTTTQEEQTMTDETLDVFGLPKRKE